MRARNGSVGAKVMAAAWAASVIGVWGVPGEARDKTPDCAHLWDGPQLLADHELCAHSPGLTESQREANIARATASLYDAAVADIPKGKLRDRAIQWLHASSSDHVAIVAASKPSWAKPVEHPTQQSFGGGGLKGGLIMLCLAGRLLRGHYELTENALSQAGYSGTGIAFVASAARDADTYEWFNPSAHGQTETRSKAGDPLAPEDVATWKDAYKAWMSLNIHRVVDACSNNKTVEAGYVLGYVLHGVQDLATHHGITNPQHSYYAYATTNPDAIEPSLDVAQGWSLKIIQELRHKVRAGCFDDVMKLPKDQSAPAVAVQYYGTEDGTLEALLAYRELGPAFKEAIQNGRTDLKVQWFNVDDAAARDAFFEQRVLDVVRSL